MLPAPCASPRRIAVLVMGTVVSLTLAACGRSPTPATLGDTPAAPAPSAAPPRREEAELSFVRDGRPVRTLSRADLETAIPIEEWSAYDPYYAKPKTFRTLALAAVLEKGFGEPAAALSRYDYVLRARDGYTVPIAGGKVFEKGGYLAVADVEVPGWEPIGEGRANPAPFYVVWREPAQRSLDTHPRPWQLAAVEIAPFEATFPHTVPAVAVDAPAMRGFRIFRESCIACHAVNREGGRVGPDLNVPKSIVEYRPEPQIRAYILDPRTFRYSNMPAHPGFGQAELDALLAYFRAMKDRKYDPEAK
jgi:mono/diheme cytochrome c family protein